MTNDSIRLKEIDDIKEEVFKEVEGFSGENRLKERIRIAEKTSKDLIGDHKKRAA